MSLRTTALLLSLLGSVAAHLPGQEVAPAKQPDQTRPAAQDPGAAETKPVPVQTPEERVARLQAEVERLRKEIGYIAERRGHIAKSIAARLAGQASEPKLKVIDAGTSAAMVAATPAANMPRKARVAQDSEMEAMTEDVLFMVNGRTIRRAAVDELVDYMKGFAGSGTDEIRMQRAVMELIRTEAAHGAFLAQAEDASARIREMEAELQKGASFADLAKASAGPGAENGGSLGMITRNTPHGLKLEQIAFGTRPGAVSPIFRSPQGFNLLKVEKFEKGETVDQDKVEVRLILVPFAEDLGEVRQVQMAVATGQIEVVLRDESFREMLPAQFR